MIYQDLREFIAELEKRGELKRITTEVDDDIDVKDWKEVIWAMTTRIDATNKLPGETDREWGVPIVMSFKELMTFGKRWKLTNYKKS